MSIFDTANSIIDSYGSDVLVKNNGNVVSTKAFLQPMFYKGKYYGGYEYKPAGVTYNERYVYIGKSDVELKFNESVIEMIGKKYIVKKCEPYFIGNKILYIWAVLAPYGELLEDEYGSDYESA